MQHERHEYGQEVADQFRKKLGPRRRYERRDQRGDSDRGNRNDRQRQLHHDLEHGVGDVTDDLAVLGLDREREATEQDRE